MRVNFLSWLLCLVAVAVFGLASCAAQPAGSSASPVIDAQTSSQTSATASPTSSASSNQAVAMTSQNSSQLFPGLPRLEGKATVELVVKGKPIVMEIDGTNAPITAGNFVDLVQRGIYNGSMFHRVIREPQPFVVQGGDPQSRDSSVPQSALGTGSFIDPATTKPRYIPLEIKTTRTDTLVYSKTFADAGIQDLPKLRHTRGAVAMARAPYPDSASAQFYVALADLDFLDGNYAVFGYVTKGMDVVDEIQQGDRITSAKVIAGAENLKK
ncbi:MAG: peptidylprolyl isomerase [Cyanobacteria bacterium]|nr:peptidylprolyl isomerase [Cyanobacteriota bacterium]MDW8202983.1 peptidylprolyl isomerase [Cyanobacteriota bacterium SKYGB_h_bin112]